MASGNGAGGGSSGISQPVPGFGGAGNGTGDCTVPFEFGTGIVSPGGTISGVVAGRSMGCSSPGMKRGSNPLGENTGRVGTG